jgi:hypothetical protein
VNWVGLTQEKSPRQTRGFRGQARQILENAIKPLKRAANSHQRNCEAEPDGETGSQSAENFREGSPPPVKGAFFSGTFMGRRRRVFLFQKNLLDFRSGIMLVRKHVGP